MSRVEPNRNVYVGHRYVPKIFGEWDKQNEYEGLSIVTHQGNSYTSKKRVPVGIDILNEDFWVVTGNYDAQVEYYRQEVRKLSEDVSDNTLNIETNKGNINKNKEDIKNLDTKLTGDINNLDTKLTGNINNLDTKLTGDINNIDNRLKETEKWIDPDLKLVELYVPNDFTDLQSALDHGLKIRNGAKVVITMKSGFRPTKGIEITDSDSGHITIKAENNEVIVNDDFTGKFLNGSNSRMPVLDCLINMNDKGEEGYYIDRSSNGYVTANSGIINAGKTGLYVNNSVFKGVKSVFSHANDRNVWATRTAVVSLDGADLSYCKGGGVAVYVSRSSILEASNSDMSHSNAEYSTLSCLRSKVTIMEADLSYSKRDAINASQSSEVAGRGVNLTHSGRHCTYIDNGAQVDLPGDIDISNSGGHAFMVMHGGRLNAKKVTGTDLGGDVVNASNHASVTISELFINRCKGNGVYAEQNSNVNIPGAKIYNTKKHGLYALSGSNINAGLSAVIKSVLENIIYAVNNSNINIQGAELTGAGKNSIEVAGMSTVNAQSVKSWDNVGYGANVNTLSLCNLRNARLISDNTSLLCQNGSQIVANGIDTGTEGVDSNPETLNTLTSNGVIYHKA